MSEPFIVIMEGPHSSFVFRVPRALERRVLDVAGNLRVAWGWRVRGMLICDGAGTSWGLGVHGDSGVVAPLFEHALTTSASRVVMWPPLEK